MRVLHLSDFHYKGSEKDIASQNILIDKLISNIPGDKPIDLFIFTGDLVFSGVRQLDFVEAQNSLLRKIGQSIGVEKTNTFLCPGNHDVNRSAVNEPLKHFIRNFKSGEQLTKLIEEKKEDVFGLSCKPTENWFNFIQEFYINGTKRGIDYIDRLYTTHVRRIGNHKIGIVSINTAWCSTGNDDKENLFFPKSELEKAIYKLNQEKVQWKVLLLHHPLADLRYFNRIELEELIYSEFHLMFSGHLHKREDFIRLTQNEGIFGTYAHAAFTKKEDGNIGFSLIDIDFNTFEIEINRYSYDFNEMIFFPLNLMSCSLPLNDNKREQIKIFKTLRKKLTETIEKANDLFVNSKGINSNKTFSELFVEPVLKKQPQVEAAEQVANHLPRIDFRILLEERRFLILGKDKTGKTSLLYKIQITLLENFTQFGIIPFYIDFAEFKNNSKSFDSLKILSRFLETSGQPLRKIIGTYKIKLLIDNFDPNRRDIVSAISEFIKLCKSPSYIIVGDQTLAQSFEDVDYGINGYDKLFFHDISRAEIRALTNKWPNLPSDKKEEFVDKIVDVLKQHSMPFNFWTLSIFLWIFSGKNTLNFNNNSELLELYIDDILDRNNLASDPTNRFSFQNYKLLLSEFAQELLIKHVGANYSMSYTDFINFIDKFKNQNIRRVGQTSEISQYLLEKGIIKKLDNDFVTFRLNGVFEYFIAFSFNENKELLDRIIADDSLYLSFKNEFEIYSGFTRSEKENRDFLEQVYNKTRKVFDKLHEKYEGDLDVLLMNNIGDKELLSLSTSISQIDINDDIMPLSDEERDDYLDEIKDSSVIRQVEVKPKKIYDTSIKKFDILERYLLINGRVFRNIENIKDANYYNEIFKFILNSSCKLGFLLVEELEKSENDNKVADFNLKDAKKGILQLISNFLPSVVQGFIHEAIGHINIEQIILNNISELEKNYRINQYQLFILYSLLLDLDLRKYKYVIDSMIAHSKMGVIRSSILIKLLHLLLLKCYDDDTMIAFIKEKLRIVQTDLNPQIAKKEFDRSFEKTKKLLLLKRQSPNY